jgi:hypothetical protein
MKRVSKSRSGVVQLTVCKPQPRASTDSEFFTTWEVLERAGWRAADASRALQIAPSDNFGFRPFAQEFDVIADVQIGRTISRANPQHGPGGGEKLFIPSAEQARALTPVGDLIVLDEDEDEDEDAPEPAGFIADMIEHELALGNALLRADRRGSRESFRFWLQDPLHLVELERVLKSIPSAARFEDLDPHGMTAGFVDGDEQILIAPFKRPPPRSWVSRLFGR